MLAKLGNLLVKSGILIGKHVGATRCPDLTVQVFNGCRKRVRKNGRAPPGNQESGNKKQDSDP
jgi:hypothetical protein